MRQLVRQAVEAAATWSAIPARRGLRVLELTHDDPVLIAALDELEPERGVALDHYRVLLEPTDAQKKNIVVLENDAPLAVLGLRRRPDFWEPVIFQCMIDYFAPARSPRDLSRAAAATGLEIRLEADLVEPLEGAHDSWPNGAFQVDLTGDYREYWRTVGKEYAKRGVGPGMTSLKRARKNAKEMEVRVDEPGDIRWILTEWERAWRDHGRGETVALQDRLRWFESLAANPPSDWNVHTLSLYENDAPVTGEMMLIRDGHVVSAAAGIAEDAVPGIGNRAMELSIEWAEEQGHHTFDMGAGFGYKVWWGPIGQYRHAAQFRPPLTRGIQRALEPIRSRRRGHAQDEFADLA